MAKTANQKKVLAWFVVGLQLLPVAWAARFFGWEAAICVLLVLVACAASEQYKRYGF
jgi:hypothetical protein